MGQEVMTCNFTLLFLPNGLIKEHVFIAFKQANKPRFSTLCDWLIITDETTNWRYHLSNKSYLKKNTLFMFKSQYMTFFFCISALAMLTLASGENKA